MLTDYNIYWIKSCPCACCEDIRQVEVNFRSYFTPALVLGELLANMTQLVYL